MLRYTTKTLAAMTMFLITVAPTHAATCPAGKYLGANGATCILCEIGYYCPGDDAKYDCTQGYPYPSSGRHNAPYYSDEPGLSACKQCPLITDPSIPTPTLYWYWIADSDSPEAYIHNSIAFCRVTWENVVMETGTFSFGCQYGPINYYEGETRAKCQTASTLPKCKPGYYIDPQNPIIDIYTENRIWFPKYQYVSNLCTPVGIGRWSDGTDTKANTCPNGTSTHGETATSAGDCKPLCDAGITKLHAGNLSFNLWPTADTAHSIVIEYNGKKCRVNLQPGKESNSINVSLPDGVYHAVN